MSRTIHSRHNKYGCHIKLFGGDSDKKDKISSNKKFRRRNRMDAKLTTILLEDMFRYYHIRDVSDTWSFRSDGLSHYCNISDYGKEEYNRLKSK